MYKSIYFCLFFSMISFSIVSAQQIAVNETSLQTSSTISWDKITFDYGEIPQGVPAEATFKLTNNGNEAFMVTDVKRTCGCTATGYSQEPILPGESTVITATYNAKKMGKFHKTIKVSTSLDTGIIPLKLRGTVVGEKK